MQVNLEPPNKPDREDKLFLGFMAVSFTLMGTVLFICAIMVLKAMWQAGFMNFLGWSCFLIFVTLVSKFIYHRLLERDFFSDN